MAVAEKIQRKVYVRRVRIGWEAGWHFHVTGLWHQPGFVWALTRHGATSKAHRQLAREERRYERANGIGVHRWEDA